VFGQLSPLNERVRLAPFPKRVNLNWQSLPGNLAFMAQGLPKILKVDAFVLVPVREGTVSLDFGSGWGTLREQYRTWAAPFSAST